MNALDKLIENPNTILNENEVVSLCSLRELKTFFKEHIEYNGIINLFSVKVEEDIKELIDYTIRGRNIVANRNNLPAYMLRSNQESIDVKSITSEICFSFILRQMNKNNSLYLSTPELNTITPNKNKPDYIIDDLLFDMKSQYKSRNVNINKKAHDRAISQGLEFYVCGYINSDIISELKAVKFFYIPKKFLMENSKLVNTVRWDSNNNIQLGNKNNDYYKLELNNINNVFSNYLLKERLELELFKNELTNKRIMKI